MRRPWLPFCYIIWDVLERCRVVGRKERTNVLEDDPTGTEGWHLLGLVTSVACAVHDQKTQAKFEHTYGMQHGSNV